MFRDSIIAAIRTGVAFGVTWLLANLLDLGVEIDTDTAAALSVVGFGLGVAAYNFVVGFLERKVNPYFGILLGIPKAPQYGAVGTETPSTNDGTVVPENGVARDYNDRGATELGSTLLGLGVLSLVIGLVLDFATRYDGLGNFLVVAGIIALVAGAVLAFLDRRSGSRF